MKIESMREFIVFSQYLNFTAAAKKLYVTQPALSYRIASMEKELGFQLVDRSESPAITPTGKIFLAEAQQIVKRYDAMLEKCATANSRRSGRIVFERPTGMPNASSVFDLAISSFVRENPGTAVKFVLSDGKLLRDVLYAGTVDAGVVFDADGFADDAESQERVELVALESDQDTSICVLMSTENPLASKGHLFAKDFDGLDFAMQSDPRFAVGRTSIKRMFARHGATIGFHDKPERDGIDFLWDTTDDEMVISDASWLEQNSRSLESMPNRIVRRIEDPGMAAVPHLVFLPENDNPALRRFVEFATSEYGQHPKNADKTSL